MMNARLITFLGCSFAALLPLALSSSQETGSLSGKRKASPASLIDESYWPPKPKNMVRVEGVSVPIAAGSAHVSFAVPLDKYLVVTAMQLGVGNGSIGVGYALAENWQGVRTTKVGELFTGRFITGSASPYSTDLPSVISPPLGLVFRPGAAVEFYNCSTSSVDSMDYLIVGYLVDSAAASMGWPPHPRDIVSFDAASLPSNVCLQGSSFTFGTITPLFDVPRGRSFIMTANWGRNGIYRIAQVSEYYGGVLTPRVNDILDRGLTMVLLSSSTAPLGIVFRGGSQVVLGGTVGGTNTITNVAFGFSGYFVDN